MNTTQLVTEIGPYLPVFAYLTFVSALLFVNNYVPTWTHLPFVVVGVAFRGIVYGWVGPLTSLGIAFVLFVVLVFLASRTASGVTLFSIVSALALCPTEGWLSIVMGLIIVACVSLFKTWKHLGGGRVWWLTSDTLSAMGLSSSGIIKKPEPHLIPGRTALTDVNDGSEESNKLKVYLPPYLLLGVLIFVGFVAVL